MLRTKIKKMSLQLIFRISMSQCRKPMKALTNPDFPDDVKSEIFYGKVQIGDSGLYLSDEILEKFSYKGYINLENQPEKLPVGGLADGGSYLSRTFG